MTVLKTPAAVGNFFAVDRRTFARACDLGMNAMVAYLVLGCGSDRENRHTTWSIDAIERYTGVSRSRAHKAVDALSKAKIVRVIQEGTRPRYELAPACEIPGTLAYPRPDLEMFEQEAVEKVKLGEYIPKRDRYFAEAAASKGWLIGRPLGRYGLAPTPNPGPEWVWLPNALVTGAANETPPVELVRQSQDAMTLRLLVDLYYVQHLRDDGGIGRQFVWRKFERVKVGEQGEFDVWGFRHNSSTWVHWDGPTLCHLREDLTQEHRGQDFFRRVDQLTALGLVEWVPHLFESDLPEAEILHAYGMGHSASLEDRLGDAAHVAGRAMVTEGQYKHACGYGADASPLWLAPVLRHIANVQMIGVGRLRYRPRTALTAAWWAELNDKGERFIQHYQNLVAEAGKRRAG
jgi:hypothetical protein